MMQSAIPVQRLKPTPLIIVLAAVLLTFAIGMRLMGLGHDGLWLDEIYGASFTNLSPFETVVATFRFDIHPPLYYLQLDLWSVLGHGDIWLMCNSVFWSTLTLVLVLRSTATRFGVAAGLAALTLCAVLGSEVYFGHELRMYAMFGALMVTSWLAAERMLADYRFKTAIPLVILLVIIGGLHSASLIAISAALLYIFPFADFKTFKQRLPAWLSCAAIVGITLVPWVLNASFRTVGQTGPATFANVTSTISGWLLGYGIAPIAEWVRLLVIAVLAVGLLFTALTRPQLTRMILCFIVWPLVFAAVVCCFKPIWYYRGFAFCGPFICIALGTLVGSTFSRESQPPGQFAKYACVAITIVIAIAMSWFDRVQLYTPRKTQYREAAAYLNAHTQQDQLIYIPDHAAFWGMARYLVGPTWGSPLRIQDPVNQDRSEKWPRIYERLGTARMQMLHLTPQTRRLDGFKIPIYVGWSPLPELDTTKEFWVVGPNMSPYSFELGSVKTCSDKEVEQTLFTGLVLYHVKCKDHDENILHSG